MVVATARKAPYTLAGWWKRFCANDALSWSVACVALWQLALESLNQLLPHVKTLAPAYQAYWGLGRWAHWDGGWYLDVTLNGYHHLYTAGGTENFAFFPAFPILVRWTSELLHLQRLNPLYIGLFYNLLATVAAMFFLYKLATVLVEKYAPKSNTKLIARLSVAGMLTYPASFFMGAYYTEALLMLSVFGALYFALTKQLWWSLPFLVLATASKSMGVALIPTVAVIVLEQWWKSNGRERSYGALAKGWLIAAGGMAGLGAYMVYLGVKFGDPLLFYKVEKFWGRNKGFWLTSIYHQVYTRILQPHYFGSSYEYILNLFMMALPFVMLGLGLWVARKHRTFWPLTLVFFAIALPFSTGNMVSFNRYAMLVSPLYVFVAMACVRAGKVRPYLIVAAVSAVYMLYCAQGFLQGNHFAG